MFDPFISTSFCHKYSNQLQIFKLHELGFIQFMSTLNYFIKERTKPCVQNVWTKVLVCAQNVWKKSLALHLKCLNKHLSSHSNIMFEQKSCLSKCFQKCSPTVHAGFVWHTIHGYIKNPTPHMPSRPRQHPTSYGSLYMYGDLQMIDMSFNRGKVG